MTEKKRNWRNTNRGYKYYNALSAFQAAIRHSDGKLALHWALELYDSGFDSSIWN